MLFEPSLSHFYSIIALLLVGGVASLVTMLFNKERSAIAIAHGAAAVASILGITFSTSVLFTHTLLWASFASPFPALRYSFHIDGLSAFFMFIISLATLAASVYGFGYVRRDASIRPGVFGFFYTLFIASLYLVCAANNGIFFLIVWECMSLASYFLIVHEHHHSENVRAGYLYLLMTSVGTAFLTLAIILLGTVGGSFDFDTLRNTAAALPPLVKHGALALALVGLGIKAGIVPLHIWLPEAHPAAPSHVSALLSGVMLKIAIFMIIRFFFDILGLPTTIWWGVVILILGAASAILGVLYALAEHDLKRLLAYHSVENIGIILLGVGSASIFAGSGSYALATVALTAAVFHTLNHAIFKGLLFLGAGAVVQTTETRNMERYGGLIRILPTTTVLFLVGSLAISGLPPLNGFASEWLTFQALVSGATASSLYVKALFVAAIGALALTSGLAAACFVKAVGITFLARPRAPLPKVSAEHNFEPTSMVIGMSILAGLCLLLGIYADRVFGTIVGTLSVFGLYPDRAANELYVRGDVLTQSSSGAVSFPFIVVSLLVGVGITYAVVRIRTSAQKETVGPVWACGAPLEVPAFVGPTMRTEVTATGFARTLLIFFRSIVTTRVHQSEEKSPKGDYTNEHLELHLVNVWRTYGYAPISRVFLYAAQGVRKLQSGNVNTYLLYMFIALCVLLFVSL